MNWEEWDRAYPARVVETLPDNLVPGDGPFTDRADAEHYKENLEIANERGGFETVIFQGKFYVIG